MPIYEYTCQKCHQREEILQKFDDKTPETCPHCGAKNSLSRVISASSFHLKGGGWYKDLYASKKTGAEPTKEKGSPEKKDDKKTNTGE